MREMKTLKFPGDTEPREIVDAKAREDISTLSEEIGNLQTSGLTTAQVEALDGMFKVCAFIKDDVSAQYDAFKTAFGISDSGGGEETEATLISISATYSGGDVVAGTAVTELTGIVVTAHYSDGSTATVHEYTLSGEIAKGENTITVTYGGMTTTFSVIGAAESSGGSEEAGSGWTDGVPYTLELIENEYVETNGEIKSYSGWSRTDYLGCYGVSTITRSKGEGVYCPTLRYCAYYDSAKAFLSNFTTGSGTGGVTIEVPSGAYYVIFSGESANMNGMTITPHA